MSFYQRLLDETGEARSAFLAIPVIRRALDQGVPRELYLAFLAEAYHHVKHTWPLLALALARCRDEDETYRRALLHYLDEERGHEAWILDDIAALGGNVEAVRRGAPSVPCQAMVGYAYYAIEHVSPYAMLGMAHVLEGVSARIASRAAAAIRSSLGLPEQNGSTGAPPAGFSYLCSHGALDQDHVRFFQDLVNAVDDPEGLASIVATAKVVYRLYGDMFRDLGRRGGALSDAA